MEIDDSFFDSDSDDEDFFYMLEMDDMDIQNENIPVVRRKRGKREENFQTPVTEATTCEASKHVHRLSDKGFRAMFRMSRDQFIALCELVFPHMKTRGYRGGIQQIPRWIRLGVVLSYLGGLHWCGIAQFFDVHDSFCSVWLKDTLNAITTALSHVIQFPYNDIDAAHTLALKFQAKKCLPGTIAAIDGVTFEIEKPRRDEYLGDVLPRSFFDRNGAFSIVMLGVAGPDAEFLHCECRWAGSKHDSSCLKESEFIKHINKSACWKSGLFVVGDGAYGVQNWLMVICLTLANFRQIPFKNPRINLQHRNFNFYLSRGRQCVERSFGILKWKWGILRRTMRNKVKVCLKIINACIVMHNWIRMQNQSYAERRDQFAAEMDDEGARFHVEAYKVITADELRDMSLEDLHNMHIDVPLDILRERNPDEKRRKLSELLIELGLTRGMK